MPRRKATQTVAELSTALNILKKKIERKERQIYKPFIPIILTAEKTGKLGKLHEVCRLVVYGEDPTMRAEVTTIAAVEEANIMVTVAESQYSLKTFKKMRRYFTHLLFR